MQIIISLGSGVEYPVTVDYNSGLLYTLAQDMDEETIVFPDQFLDIAVMYISFLNGKLQVIIDKHHFKRLFELYYFIHDDNLFTYLIHELLDLWSEISSVVWTLDFNLQWDILLYCPYQLLPQEFIHNKKFLDQWENTNLQKEGYKLIVINQFEEYHYKYSYKEGTISIYKTIAGNRVGVEIRGYFYRYYGGRELNTYKSINKIMTEIWRPNGKLEVRRYYEDNKLKSRNNYYENGMILCTINYDSNSKHDIRYGPAKFWYDNGSLMSQGNFVNNKKQGIWHEWNKDHTIETTGDYVNNHKHGEWQITSHVDKMVTTKQY